MSDVIGELVAQIIKFRDDRDWKQFHNPKDMAISLVLEAGELLEHFQWKSKEEMDKYVIESKGEIGEELADVLYWVLLLSHDLKIDILETLKVKMDKNVINYPISKSKGKSTKYNKL